MAPPPTVPEFNKPPHASAGEDLTVEPGALVTVDGSASLDPDDDPLTFEWAKTSGPEIALQGAGEAIVTFVAPQEASAIELLLLVSDGEASSLDSVTINVVVPQAPNKPPIAFAGEDVEAIAGAAVALDGSESSDPDGDALTFAWVQLDGPSVQLSDPSAQAPSFDAPAQESALRFELTVSDGEFSATDEVEVTVTVPIEVDKTVARVWEPVTFTNDGASQWDFGDGNTGRGQVITHHYALPGTYTATLNDEGSVSIEIVEDTFSSITFSEQLYFSNGGSGMWAMNDLAFVPGIQDGVLRVINVADPAAPNQLIRLDNAGGARGLRAWGHWVATSKEGGLSGCDIYDVSDPTAPVKVSRILEGGTSHNIGYWDNHLIFNGVTGLEAPLSIYDVSDPENPRHVARWTESDVHDSQWQDDRLYVAGGFNRQFYVVDMSDPSDPTTLGSWYVPGYAHNVWPSGDHRYAFTSEENEGGHLKIWDIQNLNNVQLIAEYEPPTGNPIIHNVVVAGDYAYLAYYTDGFTVLDISDPANPTVVFRHDTYPASQGSAYAGAWMVYPFGDRILVSDTVGGLFVYTKDP